MTASPIRSQREILATNNLCVATAALSPGSSGASAEDTVPFTSGTAAPETTCRRNACVSPIPTVSTRFTVSPHWKGEPVDDGDVAASRRLQTRRGLVEAPPSLTGRGVRITPLQTGAPS